MRELIGKTVNRALDICTDAGLRLDIVGNIGGSESGVALIVRAVRKDDRVEAVTSDFLLEVKDTQDNINR